MPPTRISPFLRLTLALCFMAPLWATPPQRLPQLLEELDHAGLVQDTSRVKSLISEWKKLEPTAAAPWLKEVALAQMMGLADQEAERALLRAAVKTLPTDKTLRARLAGACLQGGLDEEGMLQFRWLFEHSADDLEKLSWAMQMGGENDFGDASMAQRWFLWLVEQHPKDPLPCLFAAETAGGGFPYDWFVEMARDRSSGHELVQLERARSADGSRHARDAIDILRVLAQQHPRVQHQLQLARACIYAGGTTKPWQCWEKSPSGKICAAWKWMPLPRSI